MGDGNGVLVGREVAVGVGAEVGVGDGMETTAIVATSVGDGAEVGAGFFSGKETTVGSTRTEVTGVVLVTGSLADPSVKPLVIDESLPRVPDLSF